MQKTNFKTRLLALLTAAFMLVMCVPFAAFAEDVKSVTIYWNAADGTPLYTTTTNGNIEAPDAGDGYRWKDNMKNGEPVYVNTGDIVNWADLAANAGSVDKDGNGFYSFTKDKKPADPTPVEKTAHITFRAAENGTLNDGKNVVTYDVADVDGAKVTVPTVKAADGYEFDGWTCNVDAVLDAAACGQEQFIAGWAYYYQDSTDGYVEFTAHFKKKAEEVKPVEKTAHITFRAVENGTLNDGKDVVTYDVADVDGAQVTVPTVKAADGYEFAGWTCNTDAVLDAATCGQKQFIAGWAFYYQDGPDGYVEFTANFKKKATEPEETKKTVSVTITTNNEQGIFPDYDGQEVIHFDNLDPNTDQQFELPKVEAKPGYEFIGWHVNGNEVGAWDADAKTFGITGLAHFEEGSNVGYLTIAAVYKAETERTVEVTFSVAPDKGEFKNKELYTKTADNAQKLTTTEFDGTQYAIPEVVAKEGYKFVGWKGQGADVIAWDADAKTFGVTGLCFFNGDDATTGYATVEAVFEKVEDKKNDNSSSSSSTSSSSNKTTTASNEKQVVKAAAAPANTTKVLPKTGASNVAPLLGGSLAVVALLMGYGVYSLVLRKKD